MPRRLFVLFLVVVTCGLAYAGIDRGGITRGLVESVAPLVVGGTEFEASAAVVDADGRPGTLLDLRPGQLVVVDSQYDNGPVATYISRAATLRGTIAARTGDGFTLLGQDVTVDAQTRVAILTPVPLGNNTFKDPLMPGTRVDVHAYALPDGGWHATLVEPAQPGHDRVRGVVSNSGNGQLSIGDLQVDHTLAKLFEFSEPPRDGDYVTAEGRLVYPDTLRAVALVRRTPLQGDADTEIDIEGYVTRFESGNDFDVDGVRIRTNTTTDYSAAGADALAPGVFVSVDGVFTASGIVAEQIDIDQNGDGDDDD